MRDRWRPLIASDPFYNPHFSHEAGMFEKLSSASLSLARAPSLLQAPQPRAVLPEGVRHPEPGAAGEQRRPVRPRVARSPAAVAVNGTATL